MGVGGCEYCKVKKREKNLLLVWYETDQPEHQQRRRLLLLWRSVLWIEWMILGRFFFCRDNFIREIISLLPKRDESIWDDLIWSEPIYQSVTQRLCFQSSVNGDLFFRTDKLWHLIIIEFDSIRDSHSPDEYEMMLLLCCGGEKKLRFSQEKWISSSVASVTNITLWRRAR